MNNREARTKTPFCGSILEFVTEIHPVGSRVTCSPPPTDTDRDWLCRSRDVARLVLAAIDDGFEVGGSVPWDERDPQSSPFIAMRKGEENIIIALEVEFFRRFMAATRVCTQLNLMNKDDRVALFQAVLYGNPGADVFEP